MLTHPAHRLDALLRRRILILDGGMGTMIQRYKLSEADYRGERFADFPHDLKGNNDLLVLTQPAVIREIHEAYLAAGADIIETNTFSSNAVSMADYHMEHLVRELNGAAAKLARDALQAARLERRTGLRGCRQRQREQKGEKERARPHVGVDPARHPRRRAWNEANDAMNGKRAGAERSTAGAKQGDRGRTAAI